MSDDRYARVYFDRINRDPKFDGIRDNRALKGSWLMLLEEAEKAWPSPAFPLPSGWVPKRDFALFAARGIIDVTSDGRFYMHGLSTIRAERSTRASSAAHARWDASRTANGNAERIAPAFPRAMPSTEQTSTDKQSTADARADPADTYWTLTGRYPTDKTITWIDDLAAQYGTDALVTAMAVCHQHDSEVGTLLGRVTTSLKRDARKLDLEERRAEQTKIAENRGKGGSVQLLISRHNNGQHPDRVPGCPSCEAAA